MYILSTKIVNSLLPAESIRTEGNRIKAAVEQLTPFSLPGSDITVNYRFVPSMIDGKVSSYPNKK